jgi:hypothetical protein
MNYPDAKGKPRKISDHENHCRQSSLFVHRAVSLVYTPAKRDRGCLREALIAPDSMTLGTLAKQHGYRTAAVGNWHLGWDWPIAKEQCALLQAERKPAKDDEAKSDGGADVPNWPPYCFIENERTLRFPSEFLPAADFARNLASQQGPACPQDNSCD